MLYLKVNLDVCWHIKSYQVGRQSRQGTSYKKQSPRTPILGAFFFAFVFNWCFQFTTATPFMKQVIHMYILKKS